MRSFRGYKASTLPTCLGSRVLESSYKAPLAQAVEERRQAGPYACSNSSLGSGTDGSIYGISCLKTRDCRPIKRVATFSAGGSGRSPSRRKDPAFLLGAGWEGGGEDVAVAVWWDFENCNVPLGIEVYKVGVNIVSGLRMCGFRGPVSISAYGDTLQLSRSTQEALASTGIRLHHIPSGGKDSSDRALLVDLILWTFEHPPPAHLFLISGDRDFSNALHRLRMMNYNILLACPAGTIVSPALLGAATQVWQWNSLVRGEGLLSANPCPDSRPPDGPSGGGIAARQTAQKPYSLSSLHPGLRGPDGNGPLVNGGGKSNSPPPSPSPTLRPKAVQEHTAFPDGATNPDGAAMSSPHPPPEGLKATEDKRESPEEAELSRTNSNSLLREVSAEVLQQFHNILVSHPNGIMLADLQTYMLNDKLDFERDFYGHGKIVPLLFSLPHVVRLERVLMKDNRSWSYLLTSTAKPAQSKQEGSNVAADNTRPTKGTIDQEAQKTLKSTQINPDHPSNTSESPAAGNQGKVNLPAVLEVTNSSTEKAPETASADPQTPVQQSVEPKKLEAKDSEQSTKEAVQLSWSSPSVQEGKLDQRDTHVVDEKVPSQGLHSFLSSITSMFRRWRKDQVVDNNSSFGPQGSSSIADKTIVGISDLDRKKIVCPEESSTNSAKRDREKERFESGGLDADDILHKPLVDDSKQRLQRSDGDSEEKVEAVCDKGATTEKITTQQSKKDSKRSWKTWLFGPIQEKSSSVTGRPNTDSSISPAIYELSDLENVTWKEVLSWPGKPTQISRGSESELRATSLNAVIGNEDETLMRSSASSSTTEGRKLDQGKNSNGYVLEDLKEYLRTAECTAMLSKAPNLMAVVDTLRTTGPDKFSGLQSSQVADLIDEVAKTEEGLNYQYLTAPVPHSVRGSDKVVADQLQTNPVEQSIEIVKGQVTQSFDESILPKEQGSNMILRFQDEESPNGSRHDELLSNRSVEFPSSSKNGISILKQEDQIRSQDSDSIPLRYSDSMEDSTSAATVVPRTSPSKTEASSPSLGEFQEWFLAAVKEAYKSSERTRRIGFDLSLVKPDFEREFRVRLDPRVYGFVKLQDLVASISAVRVTRPRHDMCVVYLLKEGKGFEEDQNQRGETVVNALKASRWPQMYHDCKSLVRELMLENPEGLPGTKLKPLFVSRFQYPLDHKRVGYQKMSDLLRLMPDVVSVNGKYLVPSEELLLTLKTETRGEENTSDRELIIEEDNVAGDTLSQSWQDANLEKVGFESTESWGEIDTEGNGSPSPSEDIREATLDDVSGLQGQHVCSSSTSEMLFIRENVVAQAFVSAETNSEGKTERPEAAPFSAEVQVSEVEVFRPEVLNTGFQVDQEGRDSTGLAGCESPLLPCELLDNVVEVKCEVDKDSGDELAPLVSLVEGREGHQSFPSDGGRDTCDKEESLIIEEPENGTVYSEEGLEASSATAVLDDISKPEREERIKLAPSKGQGVEPETMSTLGAVGNMERGTAAEDPPARLDNMSWDVSAGFDNADCKQPQESEVPQSVKTFEGKDENFSTTEISSSLELVDRTSGEKHILNEEIMIDIGESSGYKMSDTEMKVRPSREEKSREGPIMPDDNAISSAVSLTGETKKGFEGLMGNVPLDMELKASSSVDEESFEKPCTEGDTADGLRVSQDERIVSVSEKPSTSGASDLTKTRTTVYAKLPEQSDGSELVYDSQPPREEERQTSADAANPGEEKLTTAAEATQEGRKQGLHPGSISSDRFMESLKSIWKRLFS